MDRTDLIEEKLNECSPGTVPLKTIGRHVWIEQIKLCNKKVN
jgi:hypothetical protein